MEIALSNFTASTLASANFVLTGGPAGAAGAPINLGLTNPIGALGLFTVMLSGVPAGWVLNGGVDNGNGSWTVQTLDPASLSVTAPENYSGALKLDVVETWTNADGSIASAIAVQNVEVYAPGSPIFAWSGDDTLTGSSADDLFVLAQPIGNDTIHNFDAAHDKIDLVGFAGMSSFTDVQAHVADNANGNAVITLGAGETITLAGVDASALSASDFVFDQTPVIHNPGTMAVDDGAILPLGGIIDNTGTIALGSTGTETDLEIPDRARRCRATATSRCPTTAAT